VQASVYDAFEAKLAARVKTMKVGNGAEDGVTQGPLINAKAVEKVERLLPMPSRTARRSMWRPSSRPRGAFFEPTVVTGVTADMAISREEIFGPVATLTRFKDEAEAIRLANDTDYGLASYFYAATSAG